MALLIPETPSQDKGGLVVQVLAIPHLWLPTSNQQDPYWSNLDPPDPPAKTPDPQQEDSHHVFVFGVQFQHKYNLFSLKLVVG